ncbi:hypothetical protein [Streptomyces varsoviensis]|uniref:Lipoprotein n=1 Tax=Streptomyces varsoviensis TaxID=67373 RepID=A0ABR5IVI6_9ACTN|nr:hypothetical protein [Streptomyces varsoviensis]KOG85147.1 hypothetical protein ADK38_38300 [Streptomyces varsoviensis]
MRTTRWGGWAALAGGAVLCAVGWYGISGERFAERQLPYLASCTVPGAALIVAGAVLLAFGDQGAAAERVAELHRLLVAAEPPETTEPSETEEDPAGVGAAHGRLVTVPGGTMYHRADCPLAEGRTGVGAPDAFDGLSPCPVCEPAAPPPPS